MIRISKSRPHVGKGHSCTTLNVSFVFASLRALHPWHPVRADWLRALCPWPAAATLLRARMRPLVHYAVLSLNLCDFLLLLLTLLNKAQAPHAVSWIA